MTRLDDDASFVSPIKCFYLLALGPAASSLAAVVTLGGLSSSQRDMASSVVVALFKFKRRSIDAMRVSNGALGIYRVRSDSSRLRSLPGLSGSWFGEREKKERGGWHGREVTRTRLVAISRREADKELHCSITWRRINTNHVKRHSAQDDGGKKVGCLLVPSATHLGSSRIDRYKKVTLSYQIRCVHPQPQPPLIIQ